MNISQGAFSLKKLSNVIEWRLLAFLVLFMDVKLAVKIIAIVAIYFLQPNLRFGFSLKNSRLPLFYLLMIAIALINFAIVQNFTINYSIVAFTGILLWAVCILAVHQIKIFVERTDINILHNTLLAFFIFNVAFSFINLFAIFMEIGFRNPFLYQGNYQKYFINTGDYIKGITFDTSTTNALINCFGIVYFLYRKNYPLALACMITLLITASNFSNAILLLVFAGLFLFNKIKEQKSIMVLCLALMVIFFAKVSPQNDIYLSETIKNYFIKPSGNISAAPKIIPLRERPDSLLTPETRKQKTAILYLDSLERERLQIHSGPDNIISSIPFSQKPEIPKDSIHTASYQWKRDTTLFQRQLLSWLHNQPSFLPTQYEAGVPGKIIAFIQSYHFLNHHPYQIITGTGIANFSSKLAFRATGLSLAGRFPEKFSYYNTGFLNNHFSLYAHFFTQNAESHSIIHNPASVYDQLFTEYGLIGLGAFGFYYIGFFIRKRQKLTYGIPLLIMLLAAFMVDYWFEQLSIVVLFELMILINIKENTNAVTDV